MEKAEHLRIGQLGEGIAVRYLLDRGFYVQDRNFRRPYGEIDIVASKDEKLHFIEVKSVSCETLDKKGTHGTKGEYNPADNVHPWKLKRLNRIVEAYLLYKYPDDEPQWQLDVFCVYLSDKERKARVEVLEDIDL